MTELDNLALATSLILYKFTEGKEGYGEWWDVANALEKVLPSLTRHIAATVAHRIEDFRSRI